MKQFYKADVQYTQKSELVVAADSEERVREMVNESIIPGTEGFQINSITVLDDDELEAVQQYLEQQGQSYDEDPLEDPSEGILH